MAVNHARVTVGDTATVVSRSDNDRDGHSVTVQNPLGNGTVYLGGAGVTVDDYGHALDAGSTISLDLVRDEVLYGVAALDQIVNVLKTSSV